MKKLYYAYDTVNCIGYFEKRIGESDGKIKIVDASLAISEEGNPIIYYVLEAEEGLINSKWELDNNKEALSL